MKTTPKPTAATVARILKALPRTADGVPVWPGMKIWLVVFNTFVYGRIWICVPKTVEGITRKAVLTGDGSINKVFITSRLFSTRAAALAEVKRRNGAKGK